MGDLSQSQRIEDTPGFNEAVDARIIDMIRSGAMRDTITDLMAGQGMVGLRVQPPPQLQREQFDILSPRVPQLIRATTRAPGAGVDIEICLPGTSNGVPLSFVKQNGVVIEIDSDQNEIEIVGSGPWWKLKGIGLTEAATTKTIYAVTHDLYGGASPDFPVYPSSNTKVYFRTDAQLAAEIAKPEVAPGINYGLIWPVAKYDNGVITQLAHGTKVGTGTMGDGDRNGYAGTQDKNSSSIAQLNIGVLQIADFASSSMAADADTCLVARKKDGDHYVSGITKLLQGTGIGITTGNGGITISATDENGDPLTEKFGDADAVNATQKSILTDTGVFELFNVASSDMTANADTRMIVRKLANGITQTGISDLLAGTGITITRNSSGFTISNSIPIKYGDADQSSPTQKSILTDTGVFELFDIASTDMTADADTMLLVRKLVGGVLQTGVSAILPGTGMAITRNSSGITISSIIKGDGDINAYKGTQATDSSSIAQVADGKLQLVDFASVTMTADSDTRIVVRNKVDGKYRTAISNIKAGGGISITRDTDGFTINAVDENGQPITAKKGDADVVDTTQKSVFTNTSDVFELFGIASSDLTADANTRILVRKTVDGVIQTGVSSVVAGDGIVVTPGTTGIAISTTPPTTDEFGNATADGNLILGDGFCTLCPKRWSEGVPVDGDGGIAEGSTNNQGHTGGGSHPAYDGVVDGVVVDDGSVVAEGTLHPYTCPPCLFKKTLPT